MNNKLFLLFEKRTDAIAEEIKIEQQEKLKGKLNKQKHI